MPCLRKTEYRDSFHIYTTAGTLFEPIIRNLGPEEEFIIVEEVGWREGVRPTISIDFELEAKKQHITSNTALRLDAFKRLRSSGRPRAQSYRTISGGVVLDKHTIPWFWHALAQLSSFMIVGGFLMLPATFDNDEKFRVSKTAVGIFAVAILTAGFAFTALLTFAVRNPLFQADLVFFPSLGSCGIGLLTIIYDFLVSSRYFLNLPALLTIIAACLGIVVYTGLCLWAYRKVRRARNTLPDMQSAPLGAESVPLRAPSLASQQRHYSEPRPYSNSELRHNSTSEPTTPWQDRAYYDNYLQNMFPASSHQPVPQPHHYNTNNITEDEMQRQQMLMLLLQREQSPSTPELTPSTYHIDWQSQEQDDGGTLRTGGHFPRLAKHDSSAAPPALGIKRQFTNDELQRPWDGVWRDPTPVALPGQRRGRTAVEERASSQEMREQRRREIEQGR